MRFTEIDLFGVYVAPMSLMMVGASIVTITLRRVATSACCRKRRKYDVRYWRFSEVRATLRDGRLRPKSGLWQGVRTVGLKFHGRPAVQAV